MQEARTVTARSQATNSGESILLEILSKDENPVVNREKPKQQYGAQSDKLCKPLKQVLDQIQKLIVALTQEQVHGVEQEEAIRHLQGSLNDEQRRLSDVRDALDKEMQFMSSCCWSGC